MQDGDSMAEQHFHQGIDRSNASQIFRRVGRKICLFTAVSL